MSKMMSERVSAGCIAGLVSAGLVVMSSSVLAGDDVDSVRLINSQAEPQNWLMVYGNYGAHMHSGLTQINRNNVGGLNIKFMAALGMPENASRHQTVPIVEDGSLFVANGVSEWFKFDVSSGNRADMLWSYDPEIEGTYQRNRGAARLGSNLYINTSVGTRLIAIDVDSGEPVFDASTLQAGAPENQRHSGPPLAVNDRILVGQSNGSSGNRGWAAAFSAEDGSHLWTFWMVPGPGEFGHDTWADDHNAWQTGGGAIWTAPSYDPDLGLAYYGTGDPAPWGDPEYRPGDNLFTVSTVAIDVNTGELAWFFQETPNESWDYDTVNPKMLYEVDGQTVVGNFSRNGFYYTLDRATGDFQFAEPWTDVNWTAGLDPKTGKPLDYDPNSLLQNYAGLAVRYDSPVVESFCPYYYGAPTHYPPTYDADRQMAYASGGLDCGGLSMNTPLDPGQDWRGQSVGGGWDRVRGDPAHGFIYGVDVTTAKVVKQLHMKYPLYGGLLGTAGDLIFTGHLDGKFAAYDKDTLQELWSIRTGTPIAAPPISFSVGGQQFIAVVAGGQRVNMGHQDLLDNYRVSSNLMVFGL